MPAWAEMFADGSKGGKEALGMACGLESPQHPCGVPAFTLARWLMRVLRSIVESPMAAMLDVRQHLLLRCLVAAQLVRDQHARDVLAALE